MPIKKSTTTTKIKRCAKGRKFAHHWKIEIPNGKISVGICIYCKKKKEFENSHSYSNWYQKSKTGTVHNRSRQSINRLVKSSF